MEEVEHRPFREGAAAQLGRFGDDLAALLRHDRRKRTGLNGLRTTYGQVRHKRRNRHVQRRLDGQQRNQPKTNTAR